MPTVKCGENKELIGCLLNQGCLWSTPCYCYNCRIFSHEKLLSWLKVINEDKKYKPSLPSIKED